MTDDILKKLGKKVKLILSLAFFIIIFVMVTGNFTNAKSNIYVDNDNNGNMTGDSANPYKDIQRALDEAKEKDVKVFIRDGKYFVDQIKIPEGVSLVGISEDPEKVVIHGNGRDSVVKMYNRTKLENVTITAGKNGVEINDDSKALIWNCRIMDNKKDGVNIEEAPLIDKRQVNIHKSYIARNGWNGIYSEKRKFYLEDNEIDNNLRDGIEIAAGSEGTIKDINIKNNGGVGLKVYTANSTINLKDVTIKDNDKSGLEIRGNGQDGWINLDRKTKIFKNDGFGIVRLSIDRDYDDQFWRDTLKINDDVRFWENKKGNISGKIRI